MRKKMKKYRSKLLPVFPQGADKLKTEKLDHFRANNNLNRLIKYSSEEARIKYRYKKIRDN